MPVSVLVPGSLSRWFGGADEVSSEGTTLDECLDHVAERFPLFSERLNHPEGKASGLLVFLNGDNYLSLSGLETRVKDGDEISIIPLSAGG
ncbi:MAG: MoaD/ThiS family protein [Thermodesulfobacteriota bacterium]